MPDANDLVVVRVETPEDETPKLTADQQLPPGRTTRMSISELLDLKGLPFALIRRAGDDQTTNLEALDHFEFNGIDQGSGEVSVSSGGAQDQASGLITLAGGGIWLLIAWTNAIFSGATGSMSFRWRNNTAGANIGFDGLCLPMTSASHEHPLGVAHAILPTTGDVEVELRILSETVLTQLNESDSGGPRALAIRLSA